MKPFLRVDHEPAWLAMRHDHDDPSQRTRPKPETAQPPAAVSQTYRDALIEYAQKSDVGAAIQEFRAAVVAEMRGDTTPVSELADGGGLPAEHADAISGRYTAGEYYELAAARLDELSELPRPAYESWQRDDSRTAPSTPPVPISERMRLLCADISRNAYKRPSDIRTRRADGSELSSAEIERERKRAHRDLYRVKLGGDE